MNFWIVIVFCDLLYITSTTCTLSPPTTKLKKNKEKIEIKALSVDQDVFDRGLVTQDIKSHHIWKEAGRYYHNTKQRQFTGEVLGYITPWNRGGFEVAKTFHGKHSSFSPVWLTVKPSHTSKKFEILDNDVQKEWLDEMRTLNDGNHTVRISPRVLFQDWTAKNISLFNEENQRKLVSALAEKLDCNGFVLELWNQFIFMTTKAKILSFIKSLAKHIKKKNFEVILAIPPAGGPEDKTFSQASFDELAPHVDYFSLMTYDFSNPQRPGPNSPIKWARECVKRLVPDNNDPRRSQILMGLNFYGNNYTPEGGGPIIGTEFLKIMASFKGKIKWDDDSKEHFFEHRTPGGNHYIFYPTIYSLKHRIELAKDLRTGLSIWEIGQGLNYFYDLL